MRASERQLRLPRMQAIDDGIVGKQANFLAAIRLCLQVSGIDEKKAYIQLGIDASHWAKIMTGVGHFPPNKINELMDICGNEVPLMWLAQSRHYRLVPVETETQRLLRAEREENERLKLKLGYFEELMGKIK